MNENFAQRWLMGRCLGQGKGQRRQYHFYQMPTHTEKDGTGASRTGRCSTEATSNLPAEGFTKCAHEGDTGVVVGEVDNGNGDILEGEVVVFPSILR